VYFKGRNLEIEEAKVKLEYFGEDIITNAKK